MSNISIKNSINTYDEVPYTSYPYSQSHPYNLRALGILFGMNPTLPEKSRVLELGCASGGNLIPQSISFPKSKFVGVDLSRIQINEAQKLQDELGLKNIEFKNCSITDVDESFGKFDYIICHGVISWVPEFVRQKIFEICNKNLNENGIAYISYNTLPGWNMVKTIREMMLFHSKSFENVHDRITQSRLLLNFIKEVLEGSKSPYAEFLNNEATLLSRQSDHYLRHDHLEEENKPYYFSDFMKEAMAQGMQYLGDTSLSTMYLGNMPSKVVEKLQTINDIVRTEQYMDFITNRRFRSTLLCHNSVKLNRNLNAQDISKFNIFMNITPEKALTEVDLEDNLETVNFFLNGNKDSRVSTSSSLMKAVLYTFAEHIGYALSFNSLVSMAAQKLKGNKLADVKQEMINNAMKLILQGYISLTTRPERSKANLEQLKASKLALHQVSTRQDLYITNLNHEVVGITLFDKFALKHMDGMHSKSQILDKMLEYVQNGAMNIEKDGQKITDSALVKSELSKMLESSIIKLEANAVLE